MKKTLAAALILCGIAAQAQTTSAEFKAKYERQVKAVGSAGLGVEYILDSWAEAFPDDGEMLASRFNYYLVKSKSTRVVPMDVDKYLGQKPVLNLKDKEGKPVKYFQEPVFTDSLFARASLCIDKAIKLYPDDIQYRLDKISSLLQYEKDSPDMCSKELLTLIDINYNSKPEWTFPGGRVDEKAFTAVIQEYCLSLYNLGSPVGYEAFKNVSEAMLGHQPKTTVFISNVGTYWLVAKQNYKEAQKWYNKALKIDPKDITAVTNSLVIARVQKNTKAQKKYSDMLASIEGASKSK